LYPATRAYTYRQKVQRSFAAEFLSPFAAVDEILSGDFSMEKQQEAADHFNVSELTIRTLLVNHHRLERDELDGESDSSSESHVG
jgi:Zn-dependent peptidase ImmA (M78 family)